MSKPIHHTCTKCGKAFTGKITRKYCGYGCARADRGQAWNRGAKGGKGKPKTRVLKVCEGCGVTFEVFAYQSSTRRFCNMSCYHKKRWGGVKSSDQSCDHCGKVFPVFACEPRRFCSHACYTFSGAGAKSGSDSPQWKGGTSSHYRRGANWKLQAEAARIRDNRQCKSCGKSENALTGKRRRLDVHHIIPWSVSHSNDIENLVTLCRSCHHRNEPKPETVALLAACLKHRESFLASARQAWGL